MPKWGFGVKTVILFLGLLLPILTIHYGTERSSNWLIVSYLVAFISYLVFYKKVDLNFNQLLLLAIVMRVLLFFGSPRLSDDYYRFIWDGQIWVEGINPYSSTPADLMNELPAGYDELYQRLNSPEYHSTYPPLSQYIFSIPAWFGIKDVFLSMTLIRIVLLLFEVAAIYLLFQLTSDSSKVMIYALNPLVILELIGNLHFEGLVVFFVLLAGWLYQKEQWRKAAVALSLGILAKLTPLMFLPILLKKTGFQRAAIGYIIIGSILVGLSFPILDFEILKGMFSGLDLFFRKFEFNAGLFFLIRETGFWVMGYDIVQTAGPRMSYAAFAIIMVYSFVVVNRNTDWFKALTFVLFVQLILATTVHPWYVIPLVAFSCMTGYAFPIVWSFLAVLSYIGYSSAGYTHPMLWIALEYSVIMGVGFYEIIKRKPLLPYV